MAYPGPRSGGEKGQRPDTAVSFDLHALFCSIDHPGYTQANNAEADGVLALIQWLAAAPEDYITANRVGPQELTPPERGKVRVDMNLVADAFQDPRGAAGRSRTTIQRLVQAAKNSNQAIASFTRISDI